MPSDSHSNDLHNNDFHMNEPQKLWQTQPTEAFKMSADTLCHKAQQLDKRARRAVFSSAAVAIVIFLYLGDNFIWFPHQRFQPLHLNLFGEWSIRLGFGLVALWSVYCAYKMYKVLWPGHAASDADLKTTVQSYKQHLEKRRDYLQNIWLGSGLVFCFLGLAMVVVPMLIADLAMSFSFVDFAPLLSLFFLWLVIFIPARKRRQRKIKLELEQLHSFEREYQM